MNEGRDHAWDTTQYHPRPVLTGSSLFRVNYAQIRDSSFEAKAQDFVQNLQEWSYKGSWRRGLAFSRPRPTRPKRAPTYIWRTAQMSYAHDFYW